MLYLYLPPTLCSYASVTDSLFSAWQTTPALTPRLCACHPGGTSRTSSWGSGQAWWVWSLVSGIKKFNYNLMKLGSLLAIKAICKTLFHCFVLYISRVSLESFTHCTVSGNAISTTQLHSSPSSSYQATTAFQVSKACLYKEQNQCWVWMMKSSYWKH